MEHNDLDIGFAILFPFVLFYLFFGAFIIPPLALFFIEKSKQKRRIYWPAKLPFKIVVLDVLMSIFIFSATMILILRWALNEWF